MTPRVAVAYNAPTLPPDHPDAVSESDVVSVAEAVSAALMAAGFQTDLLAVAPPLPNLIRDLERLTPDLIFNLVEGFGGRADRTAHVTGVFELLGLPHTGCPTESLVLCQSKGRATALLRGLGLPTARSIRLAPGEVIPRPEWAGPTMVKLDAEDGSVGIDQGSVVTDPAALAPRVGRLWSSYGMDVLLEEYLPGPEFNVGLVEGPELAPLPVAQLVYDTPKAGEWPILTYDGKWATGSAEYRASVVVCPAPVESTLSRRLSDLAVAAFRATGCRDYARVDFRLDSAGEPTILEVNPNPDIGPTAGWANAARASGRTYESAVLAVAEAALRRGAFRTS